MIDRWHISRKFKLLQDIAAGAISREEARRQNDISEEELAEWERKLAAGGVRALGATKPQSSKIRRRREDHCDSTRHTDRL